MINYSINSYTNPIFHITGSSYKLSDSSKVISDLARSVVRNIKDASVQFCYDVNKNKDGSVTIEFVILSISDKDQIASVAFVATSVIE